MGYHVAGQWGGRDKFQCDACPFDSLREDLMDEHVQKAHQKVVRRSRVLGPDGAPAEVQEATEDVSDDLDDDDGPFRTREPAAASYGQLLTPATGRGTPGNTDDGEPNPGREADRPDPKGA